MAKCAMRVFHEKDKRTEKARFLADYNEAKTMCLSKRMENARGTIGHVDLKQFCQLFLVLISITRHMLDNLTILLLLLVLPEIMLVVGRGDPSNRGCNCLH